MHRRISTALFAAAVLAMARSAVAQSAPTHEIQFVSPSSDTLATWTPSARTAFELGAAAARAMQWGDAADAFRASLAAQVHAESLVDLAVVERAQGNYRAARDTLADLVTLGIAPDPAAVTATMASLEPHIARVELHVTPVDARVRIDGEVRRDGVVAVDDGAHVMSIEAAGYVRFARSFSIRAGERMPMDVHLARQAPSHTWLWATVGAGSAVLTAVAIGAAVLLLHTEHPACTSLNVCASSR